ncbi:hypothetical protein DIS24_g8236 [Lasiodiplodia hormozganensis]|uniref:DUF7605 domain-containing protein n=1 Tax=Lasiodiplodia hormozganensis TaxID=869390 RepID=A0AA39Y612_9PEZI|nr:hypothetical protein DIS24_g8236 [Lasiodiplodia hormozganensis]
MNEQLPNIVTNHESFLSAEAIALSIPQEIINAIEKNEYTDEDFDYLKGEAYNAKKIYKSGDIVIGLKGESGTGKSSLINSILGYDGIAPYGNDGEACTAVVQEFRKPRPTQQMPFEAEVFFLEPQVREAALREWVIDFWDSHKSGPDDHDDEDYMGEDFEEQLESGEGSATACDAIHSLFSDHEECRDLESTKNFLSTTTDRGDPAILGQMKVWMDALLKSLGVESSQVVIRAATPDLLQDAVAPYLAHVNNDRPSPWPLVKLVRSYFDSPLLSQGIILADLPGTSDINKIRVQATRSYMGKVEYTGVVAKIDRAQSDLATNRSLVEAYKRKRGPNIFMVATYSDSINTNAPGMIDKCINMPGASTGDVKELSTLKEELDTIKLDLQTFEAQQKHAKSARNYDLLDELENRCNDLRARKVSKLNKSAEICVRVRNGKVRKALVDRHYNMLKHEILPVFCVSNSEYMIHIIGYDEEHLPKMSVEATEIPRLRSHIYGLPAKRKVMALSHHVKYVLPSLANNLAMSCSQSKLKRRDELKRIMNEAQDPISMEITQAFNDLLTADILGKIGKIKIFKTKVGYMNAAKAKLTAYSQWNSGTQKSFCHHKGQWKTKKVGRHDWNAEMLEPLVNDLKDNIRHWEDISDPLGRTLSEKITSILQSLITRLQDTAGPSRGVLEPFFSELRIQIDMIDGLCKTEAEEVEKGLGHIRQCMISSEDTEPCYFVQAMSKTYEECAALTGGGVRQKRFEKLTAKITQKGVANPFQKVHDKAKSAAQELIQHHIKAFNAKVLDRFDKLHAMFMRLFKTDQNDTPEAKALREQLRKRLPEFKARIADCGRLLEEIKHT